MTKVALKRTESPVGARSARRRITPPPAPRPRKTATYSAGTLAAAKRYGIAPHEVSGWQLASRVDELVEFHRPRRSLVPDGVVRLAAAMLEQAERDVVDDRDLERLARDYRPDPDGALRWFLSESDRPLSYRWVCQVLGFNADAVRAKVGRWAGRSRRYR